MVLHDCVTGREIRPISLGGGDALRQPENAGATDDGHFTVAIEDRVTAEEAKGAAVILPGRKHQVEHHEKPQLAERGGAVHSLSSPDDPRARVGSGRQRVVGHGEEAEATLEPLVHRLRVLIRHRGNAAYRRHGYHGVQQKQYNYCASSFCHF
nr:hypothetical protein CR513_62740 [Ipomoea batatas]